MHDLLIRSAIAVPVAVLLPLGLPKLPSARHRALIAAATVLIALIACLGEWRAGVVVACAVTAALVPIRNRNRPWATICATGVALATSVAIVDGGRALDALETLTDDWRIAAVLLGGLACVFVGGAAIGTILHPFAERVGSRSEVSGMEHAGRIIGWIERALLYGLVLVGAPDAAALVIAGKSIARFPSFKEERFAEYYLIGSLLSLALAIAVGIAVRAAIGIDPALPI